MNQFIFDPSGAEDFVSPSMMAELGQQALNAQRYLLEGRDAGHKALGWIDWPETFDQEEFQRIKAAAEKIQKESEVLVVIGIGGSYLGARAAISFLTSHFYNQKPQDQRSGVEIYFAGQNLSGDYLYDLVQIIGDRDYSVNVISKSGTTTEPALAFRFFKQRLEQRYGMEGAARRIYATTDRVKGTLKNQAELFGYETFVVPDHVGGRYSVLTAVGLLPIAAAGLDIDQLMYGAQAMRRLVMSPDFEQNPALQYAAYRKYFFDQGKSVEILAGDAPCLHMVAEWWKQLFGESEGKNQKGLFPASLDLPTDLHSLGQFIQDGHPIHFETVIHLEKERHSITIDPVEDPEDPISYLTGKTIGEVNECAMEGASKAHIAGGVPVLRLSLPERTPYVLGQLFYFFEFACGISGTLLGVNPFDQPGVEAYKNNMFRLLGKPGMMPDPGKEE